MIDKHRRGGWRKVKAKYCKACKIEKAVEVHHIISRFDEGGDDEKNLIDLCWLCHQYAPNGIEEMKMYVKNRGFRGEIICRAVSLTLSKIAQIEGFKNTTDNFYSRMNLETYQDIDKFAKEIVDDYEFSHKMYFKKQYDITENIKT